VSRHPELTAWRALGTSVSVHVTDPGALSCVQALVMQQLDELDLACSRFRTDSELSLLNRAAGRWVTVSRLFLDTLEVARRAAQVTDGDVDPTIGRALRLAGYDREFAELRGARVRRLQVAETPGWRSIEVDAARSAVRVPPGVELDLGATAKAFAADRAARSAVAIGGGGVLVNLGGDIAVAGGAPLDGWPVRVTDDHAAGFDAPGQTVSIVSGGLATSSTTVRRWTNAGKLLHHILDPTTGTPAAAVWRTVSVSAAACVDANTASTAAIVRGHDALAWLESVGLPARLVAVDGAVREVGGWPRR
jgi:thiamine biosynthesis lipoprotein